MSDEEKTLNCLHCGASVTMEDLVCPSCGQTLVIDVEQPPPAPESTPRPEVKQPSVAESITKPPEAYIQEGEKAWKEKRFEAASTTWEAGYRLYPTHEALWEHLVLGYCHQGVVNKAIAMLCGKPASEAHFLRVAQLCEKQGRKDHIVAVCSAGLGIYPGSSLLLSMLRASQPPTPGAEIAVQTPQPPAPPAYQPAPTPLQTYTPPAPVQVPPPAPVQVPPPPPPVQQPTPVVFSGAREWCPKCQTQFTVVDPSQEWVHCPNPACAQLIHRQVTGGKQKVESKAIVPAILSFLVPGVGQFMNGDTGKGFIFLVVWLICVVLSIVSCGILGLLDLIVGIWAAYDAYQGPAK